MTPESLKRAKELVPLIEVAKENIDRWEKAQSFSSGTRIEAEFEISRQYGYVPIKHLPFNVMKAVELEGYRKELATLQKEFDSL